MNLFIWQDHNGFHAQFDKPDGSVGDLHEDSLIGMTCLVKQCLTSHTRCYRPPEGINGNPIPKAEVDEIEQRAITAYAGDRFMYTGGPI